ncbi:hypothetical protein [Escherichia coli]|nr:hypothetical protein [Escherichia coli]
MEGASKMPSSYLYDQ